MAGILKRKDTLGFSDAQLGISATDYLAGSVVGALIFGYLTDRLGRKKLFSITLLLYLSATLATAFSWNFVTFTFFRALTGAGIGGEYAAVNSAVDELIPARVRGDVDLIINSTFWIGAAIGSGASVVLLRSGFVPPSVSWRLAFGIGAVIGIVVLVMRHYVPESPSWLMIHEREEEAEKTVTEIEREASGGHPEKLAPATQTIKLLARKSTPLKENLGCHDSRTSSPLRAWLCTDGDASVLLQRGEFRLGAGASSLLSRSGRESRPVLASAGARQFPGPILTGRFFDTLGRKPMISGSYILSGILLLITAWLFRLNVLTSFALAICWSVMFFVASSAASLASKAII